MQKNPITELCSGSFHVLNSVSDGTKLLGTKLVCHETPPKEIDFSALPKPTFRKVAPCSGPFVYDCDKGSSSSSDSEEPTSPRKEGEPLTKELAGFHKRRFMLPIHYVHSYLKHSKELDSTGTAVFYDMDSEDEEWLNNRKRGRINPDDFEWLIDAFERAALREISDSEQKQQLELESRNDVCCVCGDGTSEDINQVMYCDGCDMAVHQQCYGVPALPTGSWFCERCLERKRLGITDPKTEDDGVFCALCGEKGLKEAFKKTTSGLWVHVFCVMYDCDTSFSFTKGAGEMMYLKNIVADNPKYRFVDENHRCEICKSNRGLLVGCVIKNCRAAFHPMCAKREEYRMVARVPLPLINGADVGDSKKNWQQVCPTPFAGSTYVGYCKTHTHRPRKAPKRKEKNQKEGNSDSEAGQSGTITTSSSTQRTNSKDNEDTSDSASLSQDSKHHKRKMRYELRDTTMSLLDDCSQSSDKNVDEPEEQKDKKHLISLESISERCYNLIPMSIIEEVYDFWIGKRQRHGNVALVKEYSPETYIVKNPHIPEKRMKLSEESMDRCLFRAF